MLLLLPPTISDCAPTLLASFRLTLTSSEPPPPAPLSSPCWLALTDSDPPKVSSMVVLTLALALMLPAT